MHFHIVTPLTPACRPTLPICIFVQQDCRSEAYGEEWGQRQPPPARRRAAAATTVATPGGAAAEGSPKAGTAEGQASAVLWLLLSLG